MEEQRLLRRRSKALKENNETLLVSVCTDLANLYMEEGRYAFAIEEYNVIADTYKKQKKRIEFAVANRGIGEAYLELRMFDKALHHQKVYLGIAKELKNKLEEQRALATIGHIYLTKYLESPDESDKSNLNNANKFFSKSLSIAQSLTGEASKLEIADMSARLYSNLGLVQDALGNFEKAEELIKKSINLCTVNDIYEQLQRGYMSLGSVLDKKGDSRSALQQYNLAVETSKKLKSKPVLLANALLSKSEVLVKLGDFQGAKMTLFKAYKLKIPNVKERNVIENNLRVVAAMSYTEDKILVMKDTDYKQMKILYEKMGDGACELKCYEKALDYYKKMLEAANKAGVNDSELASCYYSLAETFKDNGQFEESVTYFEKEVELCKSYKDSLNTLSKIADTKETANRPVSEIQAIYERAIEACQKEGDRHEEGRMLKRFIAYLRRQDQHSEAFQREQELAKLDYVSSDSDGENSEAQQACPLGSDINLDEITDVSDSSDTDQPAKARRRNKNLVIKRNVKGETQLHTACINGKANVVKHLLEQGHPVNVRDHCGWLPLHEACICGHCEIVELLLEKGAAINDRGGTHCGGITPLHDAASNGHLTVMQLLLNKGANAVAKTDEGETVIHCLKKWRNTVQLDPETENLYQSIMSQISVALEKAGCSSREQTPKFSTLESKKSSPVIADLRRSKNVGLEEDDVSDSGSVADDYRTVMENLRHKVGKKTPQKTQAKRSALIPADEIIDDWLEDDVGKVSKKRKTNSPFKSQRRSSGHSDHVVIQDPSLPVMIDDDDLQSIFDDDFQDNLPGTSKRISQSSLLDAGFNYHNTPSTSSASNKVTMGIKRRKHQAKLTNFGHTRTVVEADSTSFLSGRNSTSPIFKRTQSFESISQSGIDPTLFVDVRIDEKLYRVPILLSHINTHTIKWLADEAAARYAKKEYMKPTLELETQNGAILADDDLISLLFPMGTSQAEEIKGRIVKWNVPPLLDRFKEVCLDMSTDPHETICKALEELSINLDLSDKGFKGKTLAPLCKALNRQTNLLELNLSGNVLTNECVQLLKVSLPSLQNLYKLSLSCTNLQSEHLQILTSDFLTHKITCWDLSDNFIGDEALQSLSAITQLGAIKTLNLSNNKLTKDIFKHSFNKDCRFNLEEIEDFNVSDNELGNEALIKILSWLNVANLKKLDVSRNMISEGFLRELWTVWNGSFEKKIKLQSLHLSRCHVQDSELFDLLGSCGDLEFLDLSYNNDLTSISLRRLLEIDKSLNLNLMACDNIFKYFTELSKFVHSPYNQHRKQKKIKLSADFQRNSKEIEYLTGLWKEWFGDGITVEKGFSLFCLTG